VISNSERANAHSSLFVGEKDDVAMKFYRAAVLANWPGKSWPAVIIAIWLIENMRWQSGSAFRHTSVRHLMALTGLSRDGVDKGLAMLVAAKLIERTYLGKGRRGSIQVHQVVMAMPVGMLVMDLWQLACHTGHSGLLGRPVCQDGKWPAVRATSGLPDGPEWPAGQAEYPIPTIPQHIPAAAAAAKVDTETGSDSDPLLPSLPTPMISMLGKDSAEKGIVCASARGREGGQVADGTNIGLGYGYDIVGLEPGEATAMVAELQKIDPNIINVDGAWTNLNEAAKRHGGDKLRAALLDLREKAKAGRLEGSVLRKLDSYCRGFATAEEAQERLRKEVSRISRTNVYRLVDVRR